MCKDSACHYQKFLVEIKCTFSHRDKKTIHECVLDKQFWLNEKLELKKEHPYMTQIQLQLYVYKLNTCHFITWNPQFCYCNIIEYDKEFDKKVGTLISFHHKYICHELVTRSLESKEQKAIEGNSEIFCCCQQPYNDDKEMIGCDNPTCKYKWIHYTCIQPPMKRAPKGKWICKFCKKI